MGEGRLSGCGRRWLHRRAHRRRQRHASTATTATSRSSTPSPSASRDLVNDAHVDGEDLDEQRGRRLLHGSTAAAGLEVSSRICSRDPPPARRACGCPTGGWADNEDALALAALAGDDDGPTDLYRSLIVGLGVEAQAVNRRADIQYEITRQVDAARDAQAGVNLDEEMTNMLSYQRAYDAAARFMTAVDQMLDRWSTHRPGRPVDGGRR